MLGDSSAAFHDSSLDKSLCVAQAGWNSRRRGIAWRLVTALTFRCLWPKGSGVSAHHRGACRKTLQRCEALRLQQALESTQKKRGKREEGGEYQSCFPFPGARTDPGCPPGWDAHHPSAKAWAAYHNSVAVLVLEHMLHSIHYNCTAMIMSAIRRGYININIHMYASTAPCLSLMVVGLA
jgi:hypothetical protein